MSSASRDGGCSNEAKATGGSASDFFATRWIFGAFAIATFGLLFPALGLGHIPAFRDTLHFYYPLWSFFDQQSWSDRWLPEWNPLDACGVPLAAEPSSATFYPLRFLFLIPGLSIGQRIGLYLWIHLLVAYLTSYRCARDFQLSSRLSAFAAVSYALSGPIYFQIYNPIFLVGAAWLPLAMRSIARLQRVGVLKETLMLGMTLAMMVLGGDPQTAYHSIMIGIAMIFMDRFFRSSSERPSWSLTLRSLGALALACLIGLALSAIQVLPTLHWLSFSRRGLDRHEIYAFSVPLWHWACLLFPNSQGSFVGEHTRWVQRFSWEPRMWVPSIHIGTLGLLGILGPALLWLARLGLLRTKPPQRSFKQLLFQQISIGSSTEESSFLSPSSPSDGVMNTEPSWRWVHWVGVVFLIAAFSAAGEWGILQWIWVKTLPIYGSFRYPAKWLTIGIWGASLLGALGMARLLKDPMHTRFAWNGFLVFLIVSLGVCGMFAFPSVDPLGWHGWTSSIPVDAVCGPFQSATAIIQLLRGIVHPAWVTALFFFILVGKLTLQRMELLVVLLLLGELTILAYQETKFVDPSQLGKMAMHEVDVESMTPFEQRLQASIDARLSKFHLLTKTRSWDAEISLEPKLLADARRASIQEKMEAGASILDHEGARLQDPWQLRNAAWRESIFGKWTTLRSLSIDLPDPISTVVKVPVFQDGGWTARSDTGDFLEVRNVGLESEVAITSAHHSIMFAYRTPWLRLGSLISFVAWIGVLAIARDCSMKFPQRVPFRS